VSYRFSGRAFIADARQAIQFLLSRGGAELRAEARIAVARAAPAMRSKPLEIVFDRPFLFLMRKRGAERPFLAVWIDNAEILASPRS
jgi:hypothetical protein